jgi:colanic acid biosynthesis glycosyl transferase WcaI
LEKVLVRVLVVSQYFWPENFRINDLCEGLIDRGHDVTVLTGKPNYPNGKIFSNFSRDPTKFNEYNGVRIVRVPLVPRGKSIVRLALNYISFPLSGVFFGYFKLRKYEFDIVLICQLSPIFSAFVGVFFGKCRSIPISMWVLDLWPDSALASGHRSLMSIFILRNVVRYIYKKIDCFFIQNDFFKSSIISNGGYGKRFVKLPNWAEDIFEPVERVSKTSARELRILFAGNIGEAQDISSVIKAAKLMKEKGIPAKFTFVGSGRVLSSSLELIDKYSLHGSIEFLGERPLCDMPKIYEQADVFFASLLDLPPFRITVPGKITGYMCMGKPILTMITGEASRVINDAKCGLTAGSGDYEKLVSNIQIIMNMTGEDRRAMGSNGIKYAKENFDRNEVINSLSRELINICFSRPQA